MTVTKLPEKLFKLTQVLFSYKMVESSDIQNLQDIANVLRLQALKMTDASKSGHPTSSASIAEIISVLFFDKSGMHFNPHEPRSPANDKLVLSKGHACPIYYAAWAETGHVDKSELLNLRKLESDLEGHPTPRLDFVDFATGSLGQGLANACGMAYSSKYFDNNPNRHYVIVGDGEIAEGSNWEALNFAGFYKLDNLVVILDLNRLGQSDFTAFQHNSTLFKNRIEAFGLKVKEINGHDISEIIQAFNEAKLHKGTPYCIIASTLKGKGFINIEDKINFHGKAIERQDVIDHIESQIVNKTPIVKVTLPENTFNYKVSAINRNYKIATSYKKGDKVATRQAFGYALKKLGDIDGEDSIVIGLDGDVKNSTYSEYLYKAHPNKFINCYIAEQLMIGVATAVGKSNKIPFTATFSTFYTRAADQIRMGAVSQENVKYVGTHSGCHIGEDGPSQMGLEDIALFRAIPGMVVFVPSDPIASEKSVEIAANHKGSVFIRTERNAHDLLYENDEVFEIGKLKVIQKSENDLLSIVSFGATLFEAIEAAKILKTEGINVRIIDIFTIKPIDKDGLIQNAKETNNTVYVLEDHYLEGGLGEAVFAALALTGAKVHHTGVTSVPRSAKPHELLKLYELDAASIVKKVKSIA